MVWYSHLFNSFPQFVMIHTVKGFSVVNDMEFPCFLYDPANVDSLISGSSAFSKSSLNIWTFSVHIMLKPSLEDFEHNLTSMGDEWNCLVVWTLFSAALLGNLDEDWPFLVLWTLLSFPNLLSILSTALLTASSYRILNSSAGIPSLPLALLAAVLPKVHLTLCSRMSDSEWETTLSWLSRSLRSFLYSFSVYSFHLFLISFASIGSLPCLSFIVPILGEILLWYFQFSWRYL